MIKKFSYKDLKVYVASNYLKDNSLFFPVDVQAIVEQVYKYCFNRKSIESTDESFLIDVYNELKVHRIAPKEVRYKYLRHNGAKLGDMDAKKEEVVEIISTPLPEAEWETTKEEDGVKEEAEDVSTVA